MNTQPAPSPQPSTNLQGDKIRMSGFDTAHRKLSNTPEDRFQDQLMLIRSMQTNRSEINDANIITKTPKNINQRIINQINNDDLYRLHCSSTNQG